MKMGDVRCSWRLCTQVGQIVGYPLVAINAGPPHLLNRRMRKPELLAKVHGSDAVAVATLA